MQGYFMDDLKRFLPWRDEIQELDVCRMKLDFSTFDQQRHLQGLILWCNRSTKEL